MPISPPVPLNQLPSWRVWPEGNHNLYNVCLRSRPVSPNVVRPSVHDLMTQWPNDLMTEWPNDRMTEWPSDRVTKWPSDQVTKWFSVECSGPVPNLILMIGYCWPWLLSWTSNIALLKCSLWRYTIRVSFSSLWFRLFYFAASLASVIGRC